jgi:hypothetical protein
MLLPHARYLVAIADQAISRAASAACLATHLSQQIRQFGDTLRAPLLVTVLGSPYCAPCLPGLFVFLSSA